MGEQPSVCYFLPCCANVPGLTPLKPRATETLCLCTMDISELCLSSGELTAMLPLMELFLFIEEEIRRSEEKHYFLPPWGDVAVWISGLTGSQRQT